jgi:hypothetical protein
VRSAEEGASLIPAVLMELSKFCSPSCRTGIPRDVPLFSEKRRANWVDQRMASALLSQGMTDTMARSTGPTISPRRMYCEHRFWAGLRASRGAVLKIGRLFPARPLLTDYCLTGCRALIPCSLSVDSNRSQGTGLAGRSALWVSSPRSRMYIVSS